MLEIQRNQLQALQLFLLQLQVRLPQWRVFVETLK
jgi:hypothetical protein